MNTEPIDRLIRIREELNQKLPIDEMGLNMEINTEYNKLLVLACASMYEHEICSTLIDFFRETTHSEMAVTFVQNKAIERQYHTYFNWNDSNANHFFGLWGKDFKKYMEKQLKDENSKKNAEAFMSIGSERNRITHGNIADYNMSKTYEEIIDLHKHAVAFVDTFVKCLESYYEETLDKQPVE
ncbi:hypothetical protein AR505_0562 [methanogenic archaeon ISO4-H5]|nr:hypothetical protein AR505_0562 [methanogenic archaeon ISO4-H5]